MCFHSLSNYQQIHAEILYFSYKSFIQSIKHERKQILEKHENHCICMHSLQLVTNHLKKVK